MLFWLNWLNSVFTLALLSCSLLKLAVNTKKVTEWIKIEGGYTVRMF